MVLVYFTVKLFHHLINNLLLKKSSILKSLAKLINNFLHNFQARVIGKTNTLFHRRFSISVSFSPT